MSHRFLVSIVLLQMAAVTAALGAPPKDLSPMLKEVVDQHRQIPGMVAAIVEGGQVTALGSAGVRKSQTTVRMQPGDLIHLGSDTKAMTATLIGQLIDQKRLTLDKTMAQIFPKLQPTMNPEMAKVTVGQLLTHTAGLPANLNWASFSTDPKTLMAERAKVVEQAFSAAPASPPGSKFSYSNVGYVVLGAIVEKETGKAWEDVIREKLFVPLGMKSAGFGPPGTVGKIDQPWGHVSKLGMLVPLQTDNPPVMSAAGRVHCTISDWAKFVSVYLKPVAGKPRVVSAETIALLTKPGPVGEYNGGWGIVKRDWAGGVALTHAGSNTMWYCVVWAAPAKDFAVLVATNVAGDDVPKICDETVAALIGGRGKAE